MEEPKQVHKAYKKPHAGVSAEKKKAKNKHEQVFTAKQKNPKAFTYSSIKKTRKIIERGENLKNRAHHVPVVHRKPEVLPPYLVAVVGGLQVGKTTLIRSLVRFYSWQRLNDVIGPITVIAGKKYRVTFVEVPCNMNCMIDIAKVADVVLMLMDITIGIEMEIFEFFEICKAYGSPKVIGILNHLDLMTENKVLRKKIKIIKKRFQVELYPGAKLFRLSGLKYGEYLLKEMTIITRALSVMKFRPLQFRLTHPHVLVDRMEDVTNAEELRQNPRGTRKVILYGYVRGIPMPQNPYVHIPGVGDYRVSEVSMLADPAPLVEHGKKRILISKERTLYAPMSGIGGVIYDKDAIYVESKFDNTKNPLEKDDKEEEVIEESHAMVESLMSLKTTADEKRQVAPFKLFSDSQPIVADEEEEEQQDDGYCDGPLENDDDDDSNDDDDGEVSHPSLVPFFKTVKAADGSMKRCVVFDDEAGGRGKAKKGEESESDSDSDGNESPWDEEIGADSDDEEIEKRIQEQEKEIEEKEKVEPPAKKRKRGGKKGDSTKSAVSIPAKIFSTDSYLPGIQKGKKNQKKYILFLRNSIYGEDYFCPLEDENDDSKADESTAIDAENILKPKGTIVRHRLTHLPADANINGVDTARLGAMQSHDWTSAEVLESIKDMFMTGEWTQDASAEKLLKLDEEAENLYGEFEDLDPKEGEEKKEGEEDKEKEDDDDKPPLLTEEQENSWLTKRKKRMEKKLLMKKFFDAEYDLQSKGGYFEKLKEEMNSQAELNRKEFGHLDDTTRIKYEGFRAGLYVRMVFDNMDSELVTNFTPSCPLIIGGVLDSERALGYISTRFRVHRWFPRILKNRDPLYLSLGWRRFQSPVMYGRRADNLKLLALKYARQYIHVEATFWGPITAVNSGFVAIQNINTKTPEFSIAGTGVVLGTDRTPQILKKLKLTGYPESVGPRTAFIKDMFTSDLEVVKFEGCRLRTQSSIRGIVKKSSGQYGTFRASFEDTIKMSDAVFLTTWMPIEVPQFCMLVRNLLLPERNRLQWPGMKTNATSKNERGVRNEVKWDSVYKPVTERCEFIGRELKVPRKLQAALPFMDKPQFTPNARQMDRVMVVKDPQEEKMDKFMNRLKVIVKDRSTKSNTKWTRKSNIVRKRREKEDKVVEKKLKESKAQYCKNISLKKREFDKTKK